MKLSPLTKIAAVGVTLLLVAGGFGFFALRKAQSGYISRYYKEYATLKMGSVGYQPPLPVVPLKDGKILLYGNEPAEIFDPQTKTSELIPGIKSVAGCLMNYTQATPLVNGNVLITGMFQCNPPPYPYTEGESKENSKKYYHAFHMEKRKYAVLYKAKSKKFEKTPFKLSHLQNNYATVTLPDGNVLFIGQHGILTGEQDKRDKEPITSDIVLVDPDTLEVKPVGKLKEPRAYLSAYLLNEHQVLIFAGRWPDVPPGHARNHIDRNSIEVFDLKAGKSNVIGKLSKTKGYVNNLSVNLGKGKFAFIGATSWPSNPAPIEIYDYNRNSSNVFYMKLENYHDGFSSPVLLPNGHIITTAMNVRDIDPQNGKVAVVDHLAHIKKTTGLDRFFASTQLSGPLPQTFMWTPEGKLLGFYGSYGFKPVKQVVQFDYDKYLKEVEE